LISAPGVLTRWIALCDAQRAPKAEEATSGLVAPARLESLVRRYCAVTWFDLADSEPDPALLLAWTVNR
jgi:hypothetical protein